MPGLGLYNIQNPAEKATSMNESAMSSMAKMQADTSTVSEYKKGGGEKAMGVVGGAAAGASIGSVAGPYGAAVGAVIGGIVGLFS